MRSLGEIFRIFGGPGQPPNYIDRRITLKMSTRRDRILRRGQLPRLSQWVETSKAGSLPSAKPATTNIFHRGQQETRSRVNALNETNNPGAPTQKS